MQPPAQLRGILALIGFTSVIAQVVLMRELMVAFYGNEISLGLVLACWLLWTALGSGVFGRICAGRESRGFDRKMAAALEAAVAVGFPLAIAAVTPLEIRVIAAGLSPVVPRAVTLGALKSPWVLQPVFAGFSILSPSWLWLAIPALVLLVGLFTWAVSGRRMLRVRRVPAWRSATIGVEGEAGCSPTCCTPGPKYGSSPPNVTVRGVAPKSSPGRPAVALKSSPGAPWDHTLATAPT